ncbi:gluconeogenesis factor YvcK family protein [Arvimicrobium flavum]|uniref:gluconeogenesis factor YvcK family protein n=1 Tax=Arvimicrobium flavum TaxID=3393320 RepID=UPI00237C2338|nr:gluconeogenesis factor YvcK family protein [Mesorhizobium shangrilense]
MDQAAKPTPTTSERPPRIVLFSGGTACRNINIALSRTSVELTRIVPAWDSGGSSKELRVAFDMLPVGDIRQALMTMAHGEGRAGEVVKICNARLSDALGNEEARAEFDYYARGEHPLLLRMEPALREAIRAYLGLFQRRIPRDFDFRNGSIGNFILTGAYLAHGEDINAAILKFRDLCAVNGHVWPASTRPDVHLSALLKDGRRLDRQHLVTKMAKSDAEIGVASIALTSGASKIEANAKTLEAVANADAIVFGPGSFYTSILPHLHVEGVAEAIRQNSAAPKIFVGNILECEETSGMTLGDQVEVLEATAARETSVPSPWLTHVVSDSEFFPFQKTVGKFRYLRHGDVERCCGNLGIRHVSDDLEDAWIRGQHDGRAVASILTELAMQAIRTAPEVEPLSPI